LRIDDGVTSYTWLEDWAKIPDSASARRGWAHHALATTRRGEIIAFHPGESRFLAFDAAGDLIRSWETGVCEAHGLALVQEGDAEYLWIADQGARRAPEADYQYEPAPKGWQVIKESMDGRAIQRLDRPDLAVYVENRYAPTGIAVFEERFGGNGDIWVSDGYGQNYVHRFNAAGRYLGSINGEEGAAGAFKCPHNVWIDTRESDPELYVADRTNHRVQVYDLEGRYKRVFGEEFLSSPSAFAAIGENLVIGELRARLAVVDREDRLIGYLGSNEAVCTADGWPNQKDDRGVPARTDRLQPGRFNSPHGLTADAQGNIYVSEWLIGGRFVKLERG